MKADLAAAGARLEEYVRFYTPQAHMESIADLCRHADITRNTMYAWFAGRTAPSGRAMDRLARTLQRPVVELWTTWEGGEVEPATLEAAVARLVEVQARQTVVLSLLVQRLDVLSGHAISAEVAAVAEDIRQFTIESREAVLDAEA
jgi:DNA-binding transcriptional regulator YiaG